MNGVGWVDEGWGLGGSERNCHTFFYDKNIKNNFYNHKLFPLITPQVWSNPHQTHSLCRP